MVAKTTVACSIAKTSCCGSAVGACCINAAGATVGITRIWCRCVRGGSE